MDSICLCGPRKQIDSIIKMAYDYPLLSKEAELCEKLVSDMKTLSELERAIILDMLNLERWDLQKINKRIRWYRARGFMRGTIVGIASVLTFAIIMPK